MKYIKEMQELIKKTCNDVNKANESIEKLRKEEKYYHKETFNNLMEEAINKRESVINEANTTAEKYFAWYRNALHKEFAMNPEKITPDAELLKGGFNLSAGELEEMLDNHSTNRTMSRMIWDYADNHKIMLNRKPMEKEEDILLKANQAVLAVRSATQRPQYAETWTSNDYLAQLMHGLPDLDI